MDSVVVSISLCNVSQKGHTYVKKTFTKDSIIEIFLDMEGEEGKRKSAVITALFRLNSFLLLLLPLLRRTNRQLRFQLIQSRMLASMA